MRARLQDYDGFPFHSLPKTWWQGSRLDHKWQRACGHLRVSGLDLAKQTRIWEQSSSSSANSISSTKACLDPLVRMASGTFRWMTGS